MWPIEIQLLKFIIVVCQLFLYLFYPYRLLSDFCLADYQKCLDLMRDHEWHGNKHLFQRLSNLQVSEAVKKSVFKTVPK